MLSVFESRMHRSNELQSLEGFHFILPFYEWFPVLHVGWLVTVQVRVLEFLFREVAYGRKRLLLYM